VSTGVAYNENRNGRNCGRRLGRTSGKTNIVSARAWASNDSRYIPTTAVNIITIITSADLCKGKYLPEDNSITCTGDVIELYMKANSSQ
jgi:hypothetical protein